VQRLLAQLPAVHVLAELAAAQSQAPRWAIVEAARRMISERRAALLRGAVAAEGGAPDPALGVTLGATIDPVEVARVAEAMVQPALRRVINATGVVLHTNLGRAPLAAAARRAIDEVSAGYCNLEYDLVAGARGSRHDHLRRLLCQLTGAEDALVVNNNAAATVLGLAALAAGRGVVVSRGELIEIGGSFRLPEILALSGCRMIEVGTTNKTRLADYRDAIDGDTALLLKVHRSNFAVVGFTAEVAAEELVALADELAADDVLAGAAPTAPTAGPHAGRHPLHTRVSVMIDLGSGALLSAELQRQAELPVEPTVAETVASGADLVSFSGDKLLGGPQAGILVGRAAAIARAKKHPLMRMVRPDKLAVAALEATLASYRDARLDDIPTLVMLRRDPAKVRAQAEQLAAALRSALADDVSARPAAGPVAATSATGSAPHRARLSIEVRPCHATVGGGAMPTARLPSWALVIHCPRRDASELDAALRAAPTPVIGRIEDGSLWLDQRTVLAEDLTPLLAALTALA
jgi:L-seryl-tRNA(Ser) seleniumtransferase